AWVSNHKNGEIFCISSSPGWLVARARVRCLVLTCQRGTLRGRSGGGRADSWAGIFCPPERLQGIQTTICNSDGSADHAVRSVSAQRLGIGLRREADEAPAAEVENGPLDHGGLVEHQRDRLLLSEPFLVLVRQLAERRAGTVEQRVPADLARPGFEPAAIDAF